MALAELPLAELPVVRRFGTTLTVPKPRSACGRPARSRISCGPRSFVRTRKFLPGSRCQTRGFAKRVPVT